MHLHGPYNLFNIRIFDQIRFHACLKSPTINLNCVRKPPYMKSPRQQVCLRKQSHQENKKPAENGAGTSLGCSCCFIVVTGRF